MKMSIRVWKKTTKAIVLLMAHTVLFLFALPFLSPTVLAQSSPEMSSSAEIGGFVSSSERTPFWLRANQWGRVPLNSPAATARLKFHYQSPRTFADTSRRKGRLNWEFGAEGVANANKASQLLLPEAYGKLRWRKWELMAGREQQIIGIVDSTLSSGSFTWSGNALPIPLVRFGIADYMPLGFLWNFVSIKGSFVHGWFNEPYIKHAYLHQKTFHARLGKPEGNVHFHIGLVHHVIWGGEAEYLKEGNLSVNGKLTTSFVDYLQGVVLTQIPKDKTNNRFTNFDGVNRIGNHVGHFDLAADWRIKQTRFLLYRQHPFEDASGFQLQNLPDGLYGLSLRRSSSANSIFALKGLALEYLYSKNQTPVRPGSRFTGDDDYFNHAQYMEGWSYREKSLGTPFFPPTPEVRPDFPTTGRFFPTNRIILYHLGMEGQLVKKINVMAKVSYSRHYGLVSKPYDHFKKQFSALLAFDMPLFTWGNTRLKAQIAYDKGGVIPDSFGSYLGIKGNLTKK